MPRTLTPAQAAHVAGVSRSTISRAIKDHQLKAVRDNRNHWRIETDELERWSSEHVRTLHMNTDEQPSDQAIEKRHEVENAELRTEVRMLRERIEELAADRDAWRKMAMDRRGLLDRIAMMFAKKS